MLTARVANRQRLQRKNHSGAIFKPADPALLGAMRTTIELAPRLDAVPNDFAFAVGTRRGHGMNGALERIERVALAGYRHRERLVVIVPANFTLGHDRKPPVGRGWPEPRLIRVQPCDAN